MSTIRVNDLAGLADLTSLFGSILGAVSNIGTMSSIGIGTAAASVGSAVGQALSTEILTPAPAPAPAPAAKPAVTPAPAVATTVKGAGPAPAAASSGGTKLIFYGIAAVAALALLSKSTK